MNYPRNAALVANGAKMPKYTKTGTTIVGLVFKGGVVLGSDTRGSAGELAVNKNASKLHYIAPNIYCGGAGTAADTIHCVEYFHVFLLLLVMLHPSLLP